MSHSPGPWRWERFAAKDGTALADDWLMHSGTAEAAIDRCVLVCEGVSWPPANEDARLIAAAPELLAALKEALRRGCLEPHDPLCDAPGCLACVARKLVGRVEGG